MLCSTKKAGSSFGVEDRLLIKTHIFNFQATKEVPALWIDDVYMTGMVREYLGVSPFYLNLRYTYELGRPIKWLHSKKKKPLPFIFVVPEMSSSSNSR